MSRESIECMKKVKCVCYMSIRSNGHFVTSVIMFD
jgi:hypothetical protein